MKKVLVYGQDEQTGRNYLMLEGTDAKVHFIQYTPDMEEPRSRGELRTDSFVRRRKLSAAATLETRDQGDAEGVLNNARHLNEAVSELLRVASSRPRTAGAAGWAISDCSPRESCRNRDADSNRSAPGTRPAAGSFTRPGTIDGCGQRKIRDLKIEVLARDSNYHWLAKQGRPVWRLVISGRELNLL